MELDEGEHELELDEGEHDAAGPADDDAADDLAQQIDAYAPAGDDEAMMELAIALSLQEQVEFSVISST